MKSPNEPSKLPVKVSTNQTSENPRQSQFASVFNKQYVKTHNPKIYSTFGSQKTPIAPSPKLSNVNDPAFVEYRRSAFLRSGSSKSIDIWQRVRENDVHELMNIITNTGVSSPMQARKSNPKAATKPKRNFNRGRKTTSMVMRRFDDSDRYINSNRNISYSSTNPVDIPPSKTDKLDLDQTNTSEPKLDSKSKLLQERLDEEDVLKVINAFSKRSASRNHFLAERKNRLCLAGATLFENEDDETMDMTKLKDFYTTIANTYLEKDSFVEPNTIQKPNNTMKSYVYDMQYNKYTFKKVNILRYRGNVFRAASKLTTEMPPFPTWSFQNENVDFLKVTRINVGGQVFCIFKDTLTTFISTKLTTCVSDHENDGILFFDRDFVCFSAILNFYRTGRLHLPPNICPNFFEDELEFWGISEHFMEPCCWSDYVSYKTANHRLKKFAEDIDKDANFNQLSNTHFLNLRIKLYKIMTTGTGNVYARWVSTICAVFILLSIIGMIIGSTSFGRTCVGENCNLVYLKNETVSNFLTRTKIIPTVENLELLISGFFLSELIFRFILCPNRLELFSDTLNWVDLLATSTTILSNLFTKENSSGNFEGYLLLLKLPRIFRLFKLTANLRSGMDAFTLTIRASANELKLIFLLLFIMTSIFGTLIFVVEMVNESTNIEESSGIVNIYFGMWWAIVTMASVGFGDIVPITTLGYMLASVTIMTGVMICQLPMPIVLKNFTVYNNQAKARFNHKPKFIVRCVDPESRAIELNRKSTKRESNQLFEKLFHQLK